MTFLNIDPLQTFFKCKVILKMLDLQEYLHMYEQVL